MAVSMLSGCSNGSDNSSTAQNSGEEPTGTITLKVAHNMDFVTIPDAVLAAGERLNEKYAAEARISRSSLKPTTPASTGASIPTT